MFCFPPLPDYGENKFRLLEVNYSDYVILHLVNVNGDKTFQLMEFYGTVLSCRHLSWGTGTREGRRPGDTMAFPMLS